MMFLATSIILIFLFSCAKCQSNKTIYESLLSLSNDTSLSFNITGNGKNAVNSSSLSAFFSLVENSPSTKSLLNSTDVSGLFLFAPINYAFINSGFNFSNMTSDQVTLPLYKSSSEKISLPLKNLTDAHIFRKGNLSYVISSPTANNSTMNSTTPSKEASNNSTSNISFTDTMGLYNLLAFNTSAAGVLNVTNTSVSLSYSGFNKPTKMLSLNSSVTNNGTTNSTSNNTSTVANRPYSVNCSNGVIFFIETLLTPQLPLNSTTIDSIINYSNTTAAGTTTTTEDNHSPPSISLFLSALKNSTLLSNLSDFHSVIFAVPDNYISSATPFNDTTLSNQLFRYAKMTDNGPFITSPLLFNLALNKTEAQSVHSREDLPSRSNTSLPLVSFSGLPLNITSSQNMTIDFSALQLNQTVAILYPDMLFQNTTIFIVDKPFQNSKNQTSSKASQMRPKAATFLME